MKQNYPKFRQIAGLVTFLAICIFPGCSKNGSNPTPNNTGPALAITSLSVNTGPYNTSVTITGTGFSTTATKDQAFFNGKAATVTAATSTRLTVTVPLAAGTGNVTVSVNNGAVISGPVFTYQLSEVVSTFAGSGAFGSVNGAGTVASFSGPWDVAINAAGDLYVADYQLIRKITSSAVVSTFAGGDTGVGDGKGLMSSFNVPTSLAFDASGNMYVADGIDIRKITPDTVVSTIAASKSALYNLTGVAIDATGNIYASDIKNHVILKISPSGVSSIFAGSGVAGSADGTGTTASFNQPISLAIDVSGNLYVVDQAANLIRKVSPGGVVTTIAGSGSIGASNGKGASASFNNSSGIAIDGSGNLYIGDFGNSLIRKITPDGTVSTLAGSGSQGATNGAANTATFEGPMGLTLDAKGNIYVADGNVIRKIAME